MRYKAVHLIDYSKQENQVIATILLNDRSDLQIRTTIELAIKEEYDAKEIPSLGLTKDDIESFKSYNRRGKDLTVDYIDQENDFGAASLSIEAAYIY